MLVTLKNEITVAGGAWLPSQPLYNQGLSGAQDGATQAKYFNFFILSFL